MNQSVVITLGAQIFSNMEIAVENTEIMNEEIEFSFLFLTIPMCMVTQLLNMSVLMMLWKKEKTNVNNLMKLDCIMNIINSYLGTFQQSPYYRSLGLEAYCYPHMMLTFASVVFNRLLPVAIVMFR